MTNQPSESQNTNRTPGANAAQTLTDFLLARIAEDEEVASAAHSSLVVAGLLDYPLDGPLVCESQGAHVAVDPARIMGECEAKRRIVDLATNQHTSGPEYDEIAKILAAVYSDHPDYREEWRV